MGSGQAVRITARQSAFQPGTPHSRQAFRIPARHSAFQPGSPHSRQAVRVPAGQARGRCPGHPAPAAAISPTDAAARQSPASLATVSRSPRNTRASRMVTAGYNEVSTAVTASRPAWVA
jgi:hypothetical protein